MRMLVSAGLLSLAAASASAEAEFSLFGSAAAVLTTSTEIRDPGGAGRLSFAGDWDVPVSAGVRVTWWPSSAFGWGVELNTTSAEATQATLAANSINDLALANGLSLFVVNAFRRWEAGVGGIRPYVGAGVGVSVPQVVFDGGGATISGRQLTGPSFQVMAGASYAVSDSLSLFGEIQGAYAVNTAELGSGGSLGSDLLTNGVNLGVSFGF